MGVHKETIVIRPPMNEQSSAASSPQTRMPCHRTLVWYLPSRQHGFIVRPDKPFLGPEPASTDESLASKLRPSWRTCSQSRKLCGSNFFGFLGIGLKPGL